MPLKIAAFRPFIYIYNHCRSSHLNLENSIAQLGQAQFNQQDWQALKSGITLSRKWFFAAKGVKNRLQQLSDDKVRRIVDGILTHASETEMSRTLHQFLELLNPRQLQALVRLADDEELARELQTKADLADEALQGLFSKQNQTVLKEFWPEIKGFIYYMLELAVSLTGVDDLAPEGGGSMSSGEAQYRLKMYMDFILYPATIFGAVMAYVKHGPTALAITGVSLVSSIAFVAIYKRFLRPCPNKCYGLENMLLEGSKETPPRYYRLDIFRKIDEAFAANKGVLLIGESGAGKTSIMESYAQRVRQGKGSALSQKFQFFAGDGDAFKGSYGFAHIKQKFSYWNNEVCFFIDEFHAIFETQDEVGKKGNAFKSFENKFRFIVGATTSKEYKEFLEGNETIDRRFMPVFINQMAENEILPALLHFVHTKHPELEISENVLSKITAVAPLFKPGTSLIDAATTLLSLAISKVTDLAFQALEQEKEQKQQELSTHKNWMDHTKSSSVENRNKLERLKRELTEIDTRLQTKRAQGARIQKIEKIYLALKQNSYRWAALAQNPHYRMKWLQNEAALKGYDQLLRAERERAGLAPCLNEALIDQILEHVVLEAR